MDTAKRPMTTRSVVCFSAGASLLLSSLTSCTVASSSPAEAGGPFRAASAAPDIMSACEPAAMQAIASRLATKVIIKEIPNGPKLEGGTHFVAAYGNLPAYCQVTGSYETSPQTGKTAHFLATLPAKWNGKYLQLGCSGSCGILLMNDPAAPPITITAQGYPGQIIEKGYATFGNDLGHIAKGAPLSMNWAIRGPGEIDKEALTDFLYRADEVMVGVGKALTQAFYAQVSGKRSPIMRSYFNGCSQGGREALVAASRFPQQFDGIIAGSPVSALSDIGFQVGGATVATLRSADANLTPQLMGLLDKTVKAQCDGLDGVNDGLIQNPAACNFRPERDLPICGRGSSAQCFTKAQAQTISSFLSAATDQHGTSIVPGYSVSEASSGFAPLKVPADLTSRHPWGAEDGTSGYWAMASGLIATLAHQNDPTFELRSIFSYEADGLHGLPGFHTVVPATEVALARSSMGIGSPTAAGMKPLMQSRTKLLLYHNLSDQVLSPYMSVNLYKKLARLHGGYTNVQRSARLFMLPGSGHCGMDGVGPTNFDALGALESWVEDGQAPDALLARQLDPKLSNVVMGKVDWAVPPVRTMPLCKFPEMARYKGKGDFKMAVNWECGARDTSMLKVGESGRQAGVVD